MPDSQKGSIAKKLTWMNLLVSATALLLACLAFISYDLVSFQQSAMRTLSAQARLLSASTTSALLFNDAQAADDVLRTLKDAPEMRSAEIYTKDGRLFASYKQTSHDVAPVRDVLSAGHMEEERIEGDTLVYERVILLDGKSIGTVALRAGAEELKHRLLLYGGIAAIVLVLSMLAALGVSYIIRKSVADPIIELAMTARNISREKDYGQRVPSILDRGELTTLTKAFNEMLEQMELHQAEITRGNEVLEQRVQERTAELVHAKEEVERTSKFKDQFLSTMSHELRTPLNAVLGFSDMLIGEHYGALNERQRRYVDHIRKGGQHLLQLINDILDISRIEAGKLQLSMETVLVDPVFSEVLDALQPLASKKQQRLMLEHASALSVKADPVRFKQILLNLIGNAIKFTPAEGVVRLSAREQGDFVRVAIHDSGPGIPPEEQRRIFDAFHRIKNASGSTEGTGLGLAITRSLVELHNGELGLESAPGDGNCFYFTLPLAVMKKAGPSHRIESGAHPAARARIMIVEDDPAASQLLESQLASAGYQTLLCDEPQSVVERAAELQPDAITLDIVMKPFNGWEILSSLKTDPRTAKIPVVVVSILDQKDIGTLLGADEYIVKPVDRTILLAAIERCLDARGATKKERPILVVEDDAPTREFITETLSRYGYSVNAVADGAEAQAYVQNHLPELVILDLILPHVSGLQLLAEWRNDARTADLPVLILTSKDLTAEERAYLRDNVAALFSKQDQWQDVLIQRIRRAVPGAGMVQG
jgi:signal transduction histidine kinase/DNA-binding response OmpR family regulator